IPPERRSTHDAIHPVRRHFFHFIDMRPPRSRPRCDTLARSARFPSHRGAPITLTKIAQNPSDFKFLWEVSQGNRMQFLAEICDPGRS
ncbi:MAG: hypothetical protein D6812_17125, partial [Deltaproteobacteria bacterium]